MAEQETKMVRATEKKEDIGSTTKEIRGPKLVTKVK
jgi:hypothetical protein